MMDDRGLTDTLGLETGPQEGPCQCDGFAGGSRGGVRPDDPLPAPAVDRAQRRDQTVDTLTILGGHGKSGEPEHVEVTLRPGDVLSIVGPTGSGKSRLLADIECLAQGDTQSGRRILINGRIPDAELRYAPSRALIAQLTQTMSFVVDLTVGEFIALHAAARQMPDDEAAVATVIAAANRLAGEPFGPGSAVTQLSGGQSRALMIADTALLGAAPVVLIDEIENAGIDRRQALALLIEKEKIVLMSTHDPILALLGSRRLVIRHGAIADVIETSAEERDALRDLQRLDQQLLDLRERLRRGERVTALPIPHA